MEFGGKDRKNPIYILIQKPDSSLISDSLGVAVVRSDLRPIIIKRTDRSGDRLLACGRRRSRRTASLGEGALIFRTDKNVKQYLKLTLNFTHYKQLGTSAIWQ
ncbi:hypothetical protein [Microcoleus sp. PH2017_30_WIL_O_A]|uniref:hypothetical protein n=1 Tax=Microcoleus sp. PH2017_30_WIL_O_A TaxID=2798840 RepID=UPI001D809877|nr:hypothetical protein [Microcoleus sp. PH2017_30_WIL_O_A]MCC3583921.1 hypothetical protein [Microcoleus sp. PH2017_30_WIL_O_A]